MTDDVAISYPEGGELSDTDRETVDALVDRLRTSVDIDEAVLPPLTVERTEGSVVLRPDEPLYVDELGGRVEVRAVSRSDNDVRTITKVQLG
jgi:hypothetical protein